MSVTPPTDQSATAGSDPDDARKRLELEKLGLEVDEARASEGLNAKKLGLEIGQIEKSEWRSTVSVLAPFVFAFGTLLLGISTYNLNTTLSEGAKHQRDFENYTKLTDEFSKGGSAKLGAIVGFRAFLRPWADRSDQTAELLTSELLKEHDPTTRRAIMRDLVYAGMPAFDHVREINVVTHEKLRKAAAELMFHLAAVEDRDTALGRIYVVSNEVRDAASQYEPQARQGVRQVREDWLSLLVHAELEDRGIYREFSGPIQPVSQSKREFFAEVPAFLATVEILRALLEQPGANLRNLDASGIAVFDVDLHDADLEGINLSHSIVSGSASGADLGGADLSNAKFLAQLNRSVLRTTSLCGANLLYARLKLAAGTELPNLIAADWWEMNQDLVVPTADESNLEAAFPRKRNALLATLPPDDKKRVCAQTPYEQRGTPVPDASYKLLTPPLHE